MTKREFAIFAAALKTYFPREQLLPNEQAMDLWYQRLEDIPFDLAELALNQWVTTNKWSPSIADIRELYVRIINGDIPDWGEAWNNVKRAIAEHGSYGAKEAMAEMDDLTREAVRRLGFTALCMSTNPSADRANFRVIYENLASKKRLEELMPPALKDSIRTMRLEGTKLLSD